MRALYASAAFGILAIAAACGGKVVFVEDDDGSGGSGASTTTTTTKPTTTTKSTTTSTTSQMSQVSTGVTSVSNVSTVGVTTGGPPFCHFGSLDDGCQPCIDESINGQCVQALQSCNADQGCIDYDICVVDCADNQGCCNQCANAASPQSIQLHDQLLACIFCQACTFQCPEAVPGFCGP